MPKEAPQALVDVIESCLDCDPSKRPTSRELVSLLSQIASNDSYAADGSQARCGAAATAGDAPVHWPASSY